MEQVPWVFKTEKPCLYKCWGDVRDDDVWIEVIELDTQHALSQIYLPECNSVHCSTIIKCLNPTSPFRQDTTCIYLSP